MVEENLLFDVRTDQVTDHVEIVSRESIIGKGSLGEVVHEG